jgi:hypothetical protein
MRLDFTLHGHEGSVDVSVEPNDDPEALGCPSHAGGFPVCTATVRYAGRGYLAALGWIQVVRSTDSGDRFQPDPVEALGQLPHPFCWFGFEPTLFDAPSRPKRAPMHWTAQSFLCTIADPSEVRAILGFAWGFAIAGEAITLHAAKRLEPSAWDAQLPLLHAEYPAWRFAAGYVDSATRSSAS